MSSVMDDDCIRVADKTFWDKCIVYSLQGLVIFLFGDVVFLTNSISSLLGGWLSSNFSRTWNFRWGLHTSSGGWKWWMRDHITLKKLHILSCGYTTVIKCRHSGEESIELSSTCALNVITIWSSLFDKSLYLQLWIGCDGQIWAGGTPLGEGLSDRKELKQKN